MKNPCLAVVAVPALAMAFALATACTNDSTALIPAGTGSVVGGGSYGASGGGTTNAGGSSGGGSQSPPADAGSGSNTPPPPSDDANAPRPDPEGGTGTGSGSGGHQDAGSGSGGFGVDGQVPVIDSGVPTGPLGSCSNPACGTDGNECGCQATDSQGNNVQLGCQAGGQCACFVNGNQDTNAFNENGACNSQSTAEQQLFLQYCLGTCN